MRNNKSSNNIVTDSGTLLSPVPYVISGLIGMALLTAAVFLILACSYCKLCADSEELTNRKATAQDCGGNHEMQYVDREDNVMVVMTRHEKPTYFGKPRPRAHTNADSCRRVRNIISSAVWLISASCKICLALESKCMCFIKFLLYFIFICACAAEQMDFNSLKVFSIFFFR